MIFELQAKLRVSLYIEHVFIVTFALKNNKNLFFTNERSTFFVTGQHREKAAMYL